MGLEKKSVWSSAFLLYLKSCGFICMSKFLNLYVAAEHCEISQFSSINFLVSYYRKILMNTLKLEGIWYFRNIKEINDDFFLRPHYFCPCFFPPLSFHIFSKVNLWIVKSERNVSANTVDCYEKKDAWGYELKSL